MFLSLLSDACHAVLSLSATISALTVGHDFQWHNQSESTCLRRLFCGVWRSIAGGVVVRVFVL